MERESDGEHGVPKPKESLKYFKVDNKSQPHFVKYYSGPEKYFKKDGGLLDMLLADYS